MSCALQILPGTGRWREAPEGARLPAQRLWPAPSTTDLRSAVPLPVNGEDC
jgi:hypothetical protein